MAPGKLEVQNEWEAYERERAMQEAMRKARLAYEALEAQEDVVVDLASGSLEPMARTQYEALSELTESFTRL